MGHTWVGVHAPVQRKGGRANPFSSVDPALMGTWQSGYCLRRVWVSECVLGVYPPASAGRFSWEKARRDSCLDASEASRMWLSRGCEGRALSIQEQVGVSGPSEEVPVWGGGFF